jgi:CRISPR-associated protein Cas6
VVVDRQSCKWYICELRVRTESTRRAVKMPVIDLSFVLVGTTFPLDHGYCLFSAICRVVPGLHGDRRIGVHPIRGRQTAPGILTLDDRSRLKLRLPSEEIAPYIALAGQALELEDHRLQVGIPRVEALIPAANLASRLVTFRHALAPSDLEEDVHRELARLGISGTPHFVPSARPAFAGQPLRRVLKVSEKCVVGYALRVTGLTAEESIRLQEEGLGGRRRMGCGVFSPFEWRG